MSEVILCSNGVVAKYEQQLQAIRVAFADYLATEGCGCCEGKDHDKHGDKLCEILNFPKYPDDSGYDYSIVQGERND